VAPDQKNEYRDNQEARDWSDQHRAVPFGRRERRWGWRRRARLCWRHRGWKRRWKRRRGRRWGGFLLLEQRAARYQALFDFVSGYLDVEIVGETPHDFVQPVKDRFQRRKLGG
jgi:hypothetical protein